MIPLLLSLLSSADPMLPVAAALEQGDPQTALVRATRLTQADAQHLDALWIEARLQRRFGQPQASVRAYRAILALDPYADDARAGLAQALRDAGDDDAAEKVLKALLARHPKHPTGRTLQAAIDAGTAPVRPSRWRGFARGGVTTLYDSNVRFADASTLGDETPHAAVLRGRIEGGGIMTTAKTSWSLASHLDVGVAVAGPTNANDNLPSQLGAATTVTHLLGITRGIFDLRYTEWFTNSFGTHRQRTGSIAIGAEHPFGPRHRLRLLLGTDATMVTAVPGFSDNASLHVMARHTFTRGKLRVASDLGITGNGVIGSPRDSVPLLGDFAEIWTATTVRYAFISHLAGVASASAQGRWYTSGDTEQAYRILGGLRGTLERFELQLDYSFGHRLADGSRGATRHEASLTARFWYD